MFIGGAIRWQLRSSPFSFFWFAPGFVEIDYILDGLLCMRVFVSEFDKSTFDCFDKEWFCFFVIALLYIQQGQIILGLKRTRMIISPSIELLLTDF